MPNAFGFVPFPQRPSPDPRQVGAALARARMQPAPTAAPAGTALALPPTGSRDRLHALFRSLAAQGGYETSGGGQTGTGSAPPGQPDYPASDDEAHSALHMSLGNAATRLANGVMRNTQVGDEQRSHRVAQLLKLGLSPFEASLLARSGGI